MVNFKIQNGVQESEIDIFGDIGESWFDEGVTFQNIKDQLKNIASPKIKLNISSLGGDVNDALVIYNLLKTNGAYIEANVMGFTASSATIIAMSADSVVMDENASFLVHNAWTGVMGNQHELRETADHLEQIDNKLINIYKAKTSMRKDTLANLMKEERWLDAAEAKEMGFVDSTYKPMKAAASMRKDIELINKSKLPKLVNNKINNMTDENLNELKSGIVADVMNSVKDFFNKKEKEVSSEALEDSVSNEVKSQMDKVVNSYEEQIKGFESEKEELNNKFEAEKLELQNSIDSLNKEVNELKGVEIVVENNVDPVPTAEKVERTEGENILSNILNSASSIDKLNIK